jgi:leucyl/phenylalanyl-tRNA--protein transferase
VTELTPEIILQAYRSGVFPMAAHRHGAEIKWYDPDPRSLLPIAGLHVSKSLQRAVKKNPYHMTFDQNFEQVIRACADTRAETWINDDIIAQYTALHRLGHAHSVEAWKDGQLVGGVYGLAIGGAFFGESMFSTATDASKIALVWLAARLWRQGFELFDAQFTNEHLRQFGIYEISRAEYHKRLKKALEKKVSFNKDQSSGSAWEPSLSGSSSFSGASSDLESSGLASSGFVSSGFTASGLPSGVASEENFSGFTDVVAFLQSITQTS